MKVAVVGAGSLIARALRRTPGTAGWRFMHFAAAKAEPASLQDVDLLINCAFDPRLKTGCYEAACDADLQVISRLSPDTRVIMLSSRLVYGPAGDDPCLHEGRLPRPDRAYGMNKLRTEEVLDALLGTRLTVLRLSNVFGDEDLPGRQNFVAMALRSLRCEGRVVLDMSPFVERDFIPVEVVAEHIVQISGALRPGVYNIGAGTAVATGRIAQWLIEGHGRGELVVTNMREFDPFRLDIGEAQRDFGIRPVPVQRIRQACMELGRRAREPRGALLAEVTA